jgi:hypothetical protein
MRPSIEKHAMKQRHIQLETTVLARLLKNRPQATTLVVTKEHAWRLTHPNHALYYVTKLGTHAPDERTFFAHTNQLPLASSSIDILVLPHFFVAEKNDHALYNEFDRLLKPEGLLLVYGANGAKQRSAGSLIHLLKKNDYQILKYRGYHTMPPLGKTLSGFLDKTLGAFTPSCSQAYWILAKKRIIFLRPLRVVKWGKLLPPRHRDIKPLTGRTFREKPIDER